MEHIVLNTRPKGKEKKLSAKLQAQGLRVIEAQMLAIDFESARRQLAESGIVFDANDWLVFTSGNGAQSLGGLGCYSGLLNVPRTAALGKKTAATAMRLGFRVEFISRVANSDAFVDEFMTMLETEKARERGVRVFLFRANTASPAFPSILSSAGFDVHSLIAYHSVVPEMSGQQVLELGGSLGLPMLEAPVDTVDVIVLTSSRAVRNLLAIIESASDSWRDDWLTHIQSIPVCVIGPKTEQTALECGFRRVVEARDTDNDSLVEAVLQMLR